MRRPVVLIMLVLAGVICGAAAQPVNSASETKALGAGDGTNTESSADEHPGLGERGARPEPAKPIKQEIRELHADVHALHRDVKRLIELLEQPPQAADSDDQSPTNQDASPDTKDLDSAKRLQGSGQQADATMAKEVWDLTLDETLQIALRNSTAIRSLGGATPFEVKDSATVLVPRNADISHSEFEAAVRNVVSSVETAYWNLWAAHRNREAAKDARDAAQKLWNSVYEKLRGGVANAQQEAQARGQYFFFRTQLEQSLHDLYKREAELRRIIGIAQSDGRLIRPQDAPTADEVKFDWKAIQAAALSNAIELVQQRRRVAECELELAAARESLQRELPSEIQANKLGTGWLFEVPAGRRREVSYVRNLELRLLRENSRLEDMELNVSHLLTTALRNLDFARQSSETLLNRLEAAKAETASAAALYQSGKMTLDVLLDAHRRVAQGTVDYNNALAQRGMAITEVHFRKGSLLDYRRIKLAEPPDAEPANPDKPSGADTENDDTSPADPVPPATRQPN